MRTWPIALSIAVIVAIFPTGCGGTRRAATSAKQAAEQRRNENLKRSREELLAFAKQRIAEDHKNHRAVSIHKIVSEYQAELEHKRAAASTITVGNTP